MSERAGVALGGLEAAAYRIPTDGPEADGTLEWNATTLVLARARAGKTYGVGYTYADAGAVSLIRGLLAQALQQRDAFDIPASWARMQRAVRNVGRSGLAACAISAVDTALWDLKAQLLGVPLARLLGLCRGEVAIYGSGGFTNYTDEQLREQVAGWVRRDGCRHVKIKIGSDPADDPRRVTVAREAIGDAELFVDANGAFSVQQALSFAATCREAGITWFEEPVTSDDPAGLERVRCSVPAGMEIAAGEYIYTMDDALRLLTADAVDVLQLDVTRCGGITGFLKVAALAESDHRDLSAHCAPALHLHVACATPRLRHLEWFHDHVRIERMLFDGVPTARDGTIRPDLTRPGHGLVLKAQDAERWEIR
jgi:L-alanine-DL-glutamate epimerase-like enolase superfamily enzyme